MRRLLFLLAPGLLFLGAGRVHAAGLNVSPVQISLRPDEAKALLTLRNDGPDPVRYQLQANAWSEDAVSGMKLTPTDDVIFFPTLLSLKPGETHNVRVGVAVPFGAVERTYRIFVEELPPAEKPAQPRTTVRVLTRIGIPIFVRPSKTVESNQLTPIAVRAGGASFALQNRGNVHLRVESVSLEGIDAGGGKLFERDQQGWYVLAGGEKRYQFELPKDVCAKVRKLRARVKGDREQVLQQELETPAGACGG
ncbi:MAG TPA: fimbria/pilus periplasmic chaperone [Myxococcales bacterium]|nr:fimbria/pilus periplasmic chaperone [Myxococcales bacterium]